MTDSRPLRSQALDLLRFPLAVVVIIAHTFSLDDVVASGSVYRVSEYPLFQDANFFVDAFLRGISVPIYFFISGFVFFLGATFNRDVYKNKLRNRVKTLLIPYIIWNALALFFILFKQLPVFEAFLSYNESALNLSLGTILKCFWIYDGSLNPDPSVEGGGLIEGAYMPVNTALWYLRDLMIIVLSTPLINWLVRKLKVMALYLLLGGYIASLCFHWPISMILGGYFFFTWGGYMSICNVDMMDYFRKYGKISIVIYLLNCVLYLLLCGDLPTVAGWLKILNAFFAVIASFNIAAWLLEGNKIVVSSLLSSSSFFLYVSHCLFVGRVKKLLFMIIKPDSGWEILSVYVLTVGSLVPSLLLSYYLLNKYCPMVLKIIAGRRL